MKRLFLSLVTGLLLAVSAFAQVPFYTRPQAALTNSPIQGSTVTANSVVLDITNQDVILLRDAANILAQKNAANAQTLRLYGTTTGPKYLSLSHDGSNANIDTAATSGSLILGGVNAASVMLGSSSLSGGTFVRAPQTTAPTCTTNCGTSPSVLGSNVAGIITMGATGVPASGFVLTFNGTWPGAQTPSCVVQSALASMVVGKMPIAIVTTSTTLTVTTNGTAPGTSDKYTYLCFGVI